MRSYRLKTANMTQKTRHYICLQLCRFVVHSFRKILSALQLLLVSCGGVKHFPVLHYNVVYIFWTIVIFEPVLKFLEKKYIYEGL